MTYSRADLQRAAGISHTPTDLTYDCRMAINGDGPRAYDWADKPHRLVYDLCSAVERLEAALRDLTVAFAKKVDVEQTRWKMPHEHPLSAYDRAVAALKGADHE